MDAKQLLENLMLSGAVHVINHDMAQEIVGAALAQAERDKEGMKETLQRYINAGLAAEQQRDALRRALERIADPDIWPSRRFEIAREALATTPPASADKGAQS